MLIFGLSVKIALEMTTWWNEFPAHEVRFFIISLLLIPLVSTFVNLWSARGYLVRQGEPAGTMVFLVNILVACGGLYLLYLDIPIQGFLVITLYAAVHLIYARLSRLC